MALVAGGIWYAGWGRNLMASEEETTVTIAVGAGQSVVYAELTSVRGNEISYTVAQEVQSTEGGFSRGGGKQQGSFGGGEMPEGMPEGGFGKGETSGRLPQGMMTMKNINKGYTLGEEKLPILKNINFHVDQGEFVAILGPSGSGKTTLMNIIGCMDVMDSGVYYLDNMAIHETDEENLTDVRNSKIGFIFQNYQLIPTYNVLQNIIMPLLMRGMNHKEAQEQCMETIKLLGLDHRIAHRPSEFSGGQKQRVSIARALVGKPAILLADEPTGALDQNSGKDVLKLFRELNEMGNTIVMITHDLNVAQSAKRIVKIVDGQLFDT